MSTEIERRLEAAAAATDELVTSWPTTAQLSPRVDNATPRRTSVLYPALSAAAVAALVVAGALVATSGSDDERHAAPPGTAPAGTTTVSNAPTTRAPDADEASGRASRVLLERLDASSTRGLHAGLDASDIEPSGSYTVDALYGTKPIRAQSTPRGVLGSAKVSVTKGAADDAKDPCVLRPRETPGRQGAPARDDRCTSLPQSDGSVVWIRKEEGRSPDRSWTTEDTKRWTITQLRSDGTLVSLVVSNQLPDSVAGSSRVVWTTPAWDYAPSALVEIVTSPSIVRGDGCAPCSRATSAPAPSDGSVATPDAPSSGSGTAQTSGSSGTVDPSTSATPSR